MIARAALLACALGAAPLHAQDAQDAPLAALAWLAGCWSAEGGEPGSGEQWMPLAGGTMFGVGRTVRNGRTVAHEFMQIRRAADGTVVFIARPSGQAEASFALVAGGDGEARFENPAHDFPQRVIYRRVSAERVAARIEGLRNGQPRGVDFPLRRVPCEAAR